MAIKVMTSKHKGTRYKPLVKDLNGRMMRSHTYDRRIDAEKEERELLAARDRGAANPFAPLPLSKATEAWIKDAEHRCGAGQMKKIRLNTKNFFLPFFGDVDIKKLRPSHIAEFVAHLDKKALAAETINGIIRSLKAMFNFHLEDDNILTNPVKRKHRSRKIEVDKEHVVWTKEEATRFLEHADRKYQCDTRWAYLFYKIALNTGMRYGEIAAIEKSDFDFDSGRIRISKAMDSLTDKIKTPKNGKTRYAPLSPKLAEEVREYMIERQIFGPLFVDKNGERLKYFNFRKTHYLKDVREAGVRKTKFHNLRRWYVTNFVENGGNEAQLRKIVGHGSVQMTDLYTARPSDLRKAAEVINL